MVFWKIYDILIINLDSKRPQSEPPIPGYQGYIPRIYTTEQGLGCRYHQMTKNGLDLFAGEQSFYHGAQNKPVTIER